MMYSPSVPMSQFWIYTLADQKRVLVLDNTNPGRYDPIIGFGVVVAKLDPVYWSKA